MKKTSYQPIVIASIFIWIGFVCAISFMEAWMKFRAPGVSVSIGLGIGKLVFGALNKVEWVLAITILMSMVGSKQRLFETDNILFLIIILILFLQTIWLLPALDARAEQYIKGEPAAPSTLHIWFVAAEIIKVISLFTLGAHHLSINKNK